MHAIHCPSCGVFGRKARRRAETPARREDRQHIAWAASLLRDQPAEAFAGARS